jgi:hypothetical protein
LSLFDRYALCRYLLEGEASARLILADLLYEAGEEELAAFARGPHRRQREGELELVLRILPGGQAIELGCAFLEHVLTNERRWGSFFTPASQPTWLLARLSRIRRLLHQRAPAPQLITQGRGLSAVPRQSFQIIDGLHLQEATECLGSALQEIESPRAPSLAIASLANILRSRLGIYRVELEWQIERTGQLLEKLLADTERTGMPSFGQEDRVETSIDGSNSHDQDDPGNDSWQGHRARRR